MENMLCFVGCITLDRARCSWQCLCSISSPPIDMAKASARAPILVRRKGKMITRCGRHQPGIPDLPSSSRNKTPIHHWMKAISSCIGGREEGGEREIIILASLPPPPHTVGTFLRRRKFFFSLPRSPILSGRRKVTCLVRFFIGGGSEGKRLLNFNWGWGGRER